MKTMNKEKREKIAADRAFQLKTTEVRYWADRLSAAFPSTPME